MARTTKTGKSIKKAKLSRTSLITVTALILVYPVGIYLMWRRTHWKRWAKIIVSIICAFLTACIIWVALNPEPYIHLNGVEHGRISTEASSYTLTGSLSGLTDGVTVTVNGQKATRHGKDFSATIALKDGDNAITVVALKGDKSDRESIIIHKVSAAELEARAEKAAQQKAQAAAKPKTEAPKTTTTKTSKSTPNPCDFPNTDRHHKPMSKDCTGASWPLTVDYVLVGCENIKVGGSTLQSVTATDGDTTYAVNGTAKSHTSDPPINNIWADNPNISGTKMDISPILNAGLALCEN